MKKEQGLVMRQIVDIARLNELGLNKTEINKSFGVSRPTINLYLEKFKKLNLCYDDMKNMPWEILRKKLFPKKTDHSNNKLQPNWDAVYEEMKKDNMTLFLAWSEFIAENTDKKCIGYSRFCRYYHRYHKTQNLSMRQIHRPGEKDFIDYCGTTMPITNLQTQEITKAQIFVSTLGFSDYTFVYATKSQSKEDFLHANLQSFKYFGGVPKILVPDNLKSAVVKACPYDPLLNPDFQDFAVYHQTTVVPARVRKPKDKSKVENAVLNVSRQILAPLRNQIFYSIEELNIAIKIQLEKFNSKPFQQKPGSRKSVFETEEKHLLNPLPTTDFELVKWKKARVHLDYHVELEGHYYSVPYKYINQEVELRYSDKIVSIIKDQVIIAKHLRSFEQAKFTVIKEHMPESHQKHLESNPDEIKNQALTIGPKTSLLVNKIFASYQVEGAASRKCLGITRLKEKFEVNRIETAASLLLENNIGINPYAKMKEILEKNIDLKYSHQELTTANSAQTSHENLRGEIYYQ